MPAYHSRRNDDGYEEVCGCAICPLKSEIKGIAPQFVPSNVEDEDIIDETLNYFRANVLFRNFDVNLKSVNTIGKRILCHSTYPCTRCVGVLIKRWSTWRCTLYSAWLSAKRLMIKPLRSENCEPYQRNSLLSLVNLAFLLQDWWIHL